MVKKKGHLWLSKPKRRKTSKDEVIICALMESFSNKRSSTLTPTKALTPKRLRMFSPSVVTVSPLCTSKQCEENNKSGPIDLVKEKLQEVNLAEDFQKFIDMVMEGKFPLDIISLRLFLETVRFIDLKDQASMRYSDQTKRFWKTGYRLFHGRFLLFMGGVKSGNDADTRAQINFAVPSTDSLANFNIGGIDIPKHMRTGVLSPIISALENGTEKEFMMCADGKKITSGIDNKGGDVDMFDYEDGMPLKERKIHLENQLSVLNSVTSLLMECEEQTQLLFLNRNMKERLLNRLKECVQILGTRLQECRELSCRQRMGMEKFKSMAGPNWKESCYVYVISGLQASLYQIQEFISDTLNAINMCMMFICQLQNSHEDYISAAHLDLSYQRNLLTLKDTECTDESTQVQIDPQYLKQRSKIWFELRKRCRITGSTLHTAIGLRGVKEQKCHFRKFLEGEEETFSQDVRQRLDWGIEHEANAVATLVGRILPTYFPKCILIEEGCYILHEQNTELLGVVSPDGSIAHLETNDIRDMKKIYAVEIKCPYPTTERVPVHYSLPEYYVCQCLAEMFVLKTSHLLYVSFSLETTTVLEVQFDAELWNEILKEAREIYDTVNPVVPRRGKSQTKQLREKIKAFVKNNVKLICEVPSLMKTESCVRESIPNTCYLEGVPRQESIQDIKSNAVSKVVEVIEKSKVVVNTGYNLMRRRASELMVWVLTNKHRNSSLETPCSLPVAYGLKDYKLTTSAMRSATNHVIQECHKHGLKILSISTDGQWIQMMSRDSNNKPLTLYQLVRDIWKDSQKLSKQELLKRLGQVHLKPSNDPLGNATITKLRSGALEVRCKDSAFNSVKTPSKKEAWGKSAKIESDVNKEEEDYAPTAPSVEVPRWVPQNVLQQVYDNPDLMSALKTVSREIASMDLDDSQADTGSVAETDIGQLFEDSMQDDTSHDPITETLQPRIISDSQMPNPQQLENEIAVVERQPLVTCKIN